MFPFLPLSSVLVDPDVLYSLRIQCLLLRMQLRYHMLLLLLYG